MSMINGARNALTKLRSHVQETEDHVRASVERTRSLTTELQTQLEEHRDVVQQIFDQTAERTDRALGDLKFYIDQVKGPFADELQLQLDLLETGGQRLDQFLAKVGDWKVNTAEGVKSIRDLLEGLDTRGYEAKIQDLIVGLKTGARTLDEALATLQERGGKITAAILQAIEAYRKGELSIKNLLALLKQAETANAGTALGDLYGQIGHIFDGGGLS